MQEDSTYLCPACGELIVIPVDISAGSRQEYVEDCPVCCRPNVLIIEVDDEGRVQITSEAE